MTAVYPSGSNTYVPSQAATNMLTINFSRNVNQFAVNKYIQILPVKQMTGYYAKITVEEAGRLVYADGRDMVWYDGSPWPERNDGTESFEFAQYFATRYAPGFNLGDLTIEQTGWDILNQHMGIHAQRLMTLRTQKAWTALTTTGNYDSSNYATVSAISGNTGTWAQSTVARQDIKRSLNYAFQQIQLGTLSAVKAEDLHLVFGPAVAEGIAESQEFAAYLAQSPAALAAFRGELPGGYSGGYNMPSKLYTYDTIVEDTAKVTTNKGVTTTRAFVADSTRAVMTARVGSLVSPMAGPSFTTCMMMAYQEMLVETMADPNNKRQLGRVIDNYDMVVTAPASGFVFVTPV